LHLLKFLFINMQKARGYTKDELAKRKAFNQAIFKEVAGPRASNDKSASQ
jgi:hypothetical protein